MRNDIVQRKSDNGDVGIELVEPTGTIEQFLTKLIEPRFVDLAHKVTQNQFGLEQRYHEVVRIRGKQRDLHGTQAMRPVLLPKLLKNAMAVMQVPDGSVLQQKGLQLVVGLHDAARCEASVAGLNEC